MCGLCGTSEGSLWRAGAKRNEDLGGENCGYEVDLTLIDSDIVYGYRF